MLPSKLKFLERTFRLGLPTKGRNCKKKRRRNKNFLFPGGRVMLLAGYIDQCPPPSEPKQCVVGGTVCPGEDNDGYSADGTAGNYNYNDYNGNYDNYNYGDNSGGFGDYSDGFGDYSDGYSADGTAGYSYDYNDGYSADGTAGNSYDAFR